MHTICPVSSGVTKLEAPCVASRVQVLVIVEGINDIEFLRRISRIVHFADPQLPDLAAMEGEGRLVFLPVGGSDLTHWSHRLAPLGLREFYIFDRDMPPLTEEHQAAVDAVNHRQGCIAALTGKRNTDNYLHPTAIFRARGLQVEFGDDDDLSDLIARQSYELAGGTRRWDAIPSRKRRQMKYRAKRLLNTECVDAMTPELLAEQDPDGDVRSWLEAIQWLADQS